MAPLFSCYREYEKLHPGLRIVYRQADIADYLQTVITARLAGTSPDIYNVYSFWSGQLAAAGLLAKPPTEIHRFIRESYLPSTVPGAEVRGALWGIPGEISTYMLVYNKELLSRAGYAAPPRSWDEVRQMAASITRRNVRNNIATAGYAFGPTSGNTVHPFLAMLMARGVMPLQDQHRTGLATSEAEEVLAGMAQLFTDGSASNAVTSRDFSSGTVGMAIMANWVKDTLQQGLGERFSAVVGVAPIPSGEVDWRTLQYSFFWAVDARSPSQLEAWSLLRWLNTPRAGGRPSCTGEMLLRMGGLTGNKADIALGAPDLADDFTRPFVEALASGRAVALPNLRRMTEIQQLLHHNIERAWNRTLPPGLALRQAERQIMPLLEEER
ncbi:ABC transporter substrate-binding protein [Pseudoroseomonas globiformis]|uniref:ABC transporter substrate-binding protein n=1 Tax=Teichococcus globiformis TaxID=2307229 RepID=A0ABV7FYZ3_9PROT